MLKKLFVTKILDTSIKKTVIQLIECHLQIIQTVWDLCFVAGHALISSYNAANQGRIRKQDWQQCETKQPSFAKQNGSIALEKKILLQNLFSEHINAANKKKM